MEQLNRQQQLMKRLSQLQQAKNLLLLPHPISWIYLSSAPNSSRIWQVKLLHNCQFSFNERRKS
jgi:hypothetical protein